MIVSSSPETAWLLAQFTDDGKRRGWITSISSTTCYSRKALHFSSRQLAINHMPTAEYAWRGYDYLYVAEQVPLDVDSRTWKRRRSSEQLAREEHEQLDSDDDMRLRSATCDPTVPSTSPRRQQRDKAATVNDATIVVAKGDSASMPIKKTGSKPTSKKSSKKSASESKSPNPLSKKPVFRTTAKSKSSKSPFQNDSGEGGVCLCGSATKGNCGEPAFRFIRRGHGMQRRAALDAVKAGITTPEKAFGKAISRAMGPWKSTKAGGAVPATTDYSRIRAVL